MGRLRPLAASTEAETASGTVELEQDGAVVGTETRCLIGLVPEELKALVSVKSENTTAIDWRRESPLLQHVQLGDVVFMDQPVSAATAKDDAFANLGYEILAQGPRGPLIVERTDGDALLIALLFHTDRSTLPYRVGFPIFVSNVVQAALKQSGLAEAAAARTSVLPPLTLAPGRAVHITGPDRFARDDHTDDRGQLTGIPAPRAGDYTITDGTAAPRHIGASLLSPAEHRRRHHHRAQSRPLPLVAPRLRRLRRAAGGMVVVPAPARRGLMHIQC